MSKKTIICCFLTVLWTFQVRSQTFQVNDTHDLSPIGRGDVAIADIDADTDMDVIITGINEAGVKTAAVYRNDGDGTYTNFGVSLPALSDGGLAVGDIDNNGLPDIFISGTNDLGEHVAQLFVNQGSGSFQLSSQAFEGVSLGDAKIEDINNDGLLDIVATGINNAGAVLLYIYVNEGNGQFNILQNDLSGTTSGSLLVEDFNNDTYKDILISGLSGLNQRVTFFYSNNKNETFEKMMPGLPAVRSGSLAAADYNMDGYLDLFISGNDGPGSAVSEIYYNNAGAGFILDASLPDMEQSAAAWGDYDHDGDPDLIITGFEDPGFKTYLFENTGTGFVDTGFGFPGVTDGDVHWLDYNLDGKLDLMLNGYSSLGPITNVYENILGSSNAKPAVPSNLAAISQGDSVMFSWDPGTDAETSQAGLSYNIYIGSTTGAVDRISPHADIATGILKQPKSGSFVTTEATIHSLSEGQYYWSAQSVDAGFKGSSFAAEGTFNICYPVSIGSDTTLCYNQVLHLEKGGATDDVDWYSAKQGLLASNTTILDYKITENDSIIVELTNALGCVLRDTLKVTVSPLPVVDLGADTSVCYGAELTLQVDQTLEEVQWSSATRGALSSEAFINYKVLDKDTIFVAVTDDNACTNDDSLIITALPLPDVDLGSDQTLCGGTEVALKVPGDSVNWYSDHHVLLKNSNAFTHLVDERDTLWAEVFDLVTGCVNYDSIIFDVFELPLADAGKDTLTCPGTSVQIGGVYDNSENLQFSWSPSATLDNERSANPLASPAEETLYILTVTDANGCESEDSVLVSMDTPSVVNTGEDRHICIGASTVLGGEPTASGSSLPYTYHWKPTNSLDDSSAANPTASPLETTTYSLVTSTYNCILDTSYVTIYVDPLPVVTVDPEIITIGLGEMTTLSASGGVLYEWIPVTGLDNANLAQPKASPETTTDYEVMVTDANGCQSTGQVQVIVKNQLFIPELFTPNGDASNDRFRVYGEGVEKILLNIYNRSGQLVFSSSDPVEVMDKGWDGSYEGAPQESGNYVWKLEGKFFDGGKLSFKGKTSGIIKLIR